MPRLLKECSRKSSDFPNSINFDILVPIMTGTGNTQNRRASLEISKSIKEK